MTSLGRTLATSPSLSTGEAAGAPTIYYLDATLADGRDAWREWLDHAAGLGFGQVLIAPPFPAAADGDRFAPAALDRLHPDLAWAGTLAGLIGDARSRGLVPSIDLVLDRVAASLPVDPTLFAAPDRGARLDPRGEIEPDTVAHARLSNAGEAEALGAWWSEHIRSWQAAGIGGVRLLGLERIDAAVLPVLVSSLRRACPDLLLFGWTPGLPRRALAGLRGAGLDYVFSSQPWWDWRSDWLWDEFEALRRVAPVLGVPEAPFGARMAVAAHEPATLARLLRRSLGLAALLGAGWMMPAGFEAGSPRAGNRRSSASPHRPEDLRRDARVDLTAEVKALNAARGTLPALTGSGETRVLAGATGPVLALIRADDGDLRYASQASVVLINADLAARQRVDTDALLSGTAGVFEGFRPVLPQDAPVLRPGSDVVLAPGEVRLYAAAAAPVVARTGTLARDAVEQATRAPRIGIEAISPAVDGGRFPVKRIAGEVVTVEADVICDGHDKLGVVLMWRGPGETGWNEARMRPLGNDRWQAGFPLVSLGTTTYTVEAWRDAFATYRDELGKKWEAGVSIALELREGEALVAQAAGRVTDATLAALAAELKEAAADRQREILLSAELAALMAAADDRPFAVRVEPFLEVAAERVGARFASWYEVFPRSLSDDPNRHGTFLDVIRHLPRVQAMGFDVLYFPPFHPIGRTNRKGRNNSLQAGPKDPGSPYAIGAPEGGHDALHPELGTLDDFQRLRDAAAVHGLELAMDFAVQCSPDHPWLKQHPDWFAHRPDGSIRFAENPPKKYEDIVNVDFYAAGAVPDLWLALCDAVLFWAEQGIRLFRVDNPHTKPLPFWQWLIGEVRARYPDAIFLAEAFTRPKVMYRLAKIGFSQSYTYFTWRNSKRELQEYLTELSTTAPRDFFRPHFFVNTPDINPTFLHGSGRPGFLIRAALAATLSGLWGVYNGFELCEGTPIKPGKEEYLDSEKYQIRAWDWDRPGNIVPEITRLNAIRRGNPALQTHLNVSFLDAGNDAVIVYEKATPDRSNVVLVAVSFDPARAQETEFDLPLWRWNLPDDAALDAEDLTGGGRTTWRGRRQRVRLTPEQPYAIWRARPAE